MLNIKLVIGFTFAAVLMVACRTVDVPATYNFTTREIQSNPYGCWTIAQVGSPGDSLIKNSVGGELLAFAGDTLFLLVSDGQVVPVNSMNIIKAELVTHKNQAGTYMGMTLLYLIPNLIGVFVPEWAGGFMVLGIPTLLTGITHSIIEGSTHRNILEYPAKNSLYDLNRFSRFPSGLPENLDFNQLTLKKIKPKSY